MGPTPLTTSAFPYTVPYSNPYTQRKSQSTSSSLPSSQSPQQKLEHALNILVRSNNVPSTQNIEHLCGLVERACDFIGGSPRNNQQQQQSLSSLSSSCWSLSMAESVAKFVVRIFGKMESINMTGRNPEGYPSTLCFLARSLDQWSHDDSIMYSVVTDEYEVDIDHRISLRDVLHKLAVGFNDPLIQNPAMMGLSIIWRYLSRIQFLISWRSPTSDFPTRSIDSAWWIRDEQALADFSFKALLNEEKKEEQDYPKAYVFPNREELKTSWISILIGLLKHDDGVSWLHRYSSQNKESFQKITQGLMETIRKINDPTLTSRLSLHYTIACASLLFLLNQKDCVEQSNELQQLIRSTGIVDSAFHSAFGIFGANNSPRGPRWTFENRDTGTLRWVEEFIFVWSLCSDVETRRLALDGNLERHWKPHVEQCWRSLLTEDYSNPDDVYRKLKHCKELLSRLVLMYSMHYDSVRTSLFAFMSQLSNGGRESGHYLHHPCLALLSSLQHLSFNPDPSVALCAASLMKALLSERGSVAPHDDVFVKAVDFGMTRGLIQGIVEIAKSGAKSEDPVVFRPTLLNLLDNLDLILSWEPTLRAVTHLVDSESVEVLIHVMMPIDRSIDQVGAFMMGSSHNHNGVMEDFVDSDTPPAGNLSRLDERSICIEKEEEQKATTGIDHAIRLAVAVVLSHFAYTSLESNPQIQDKKESEAGLRLIQSRIRASVTSFFSASTSTFDRCSSLVNNMETTRRRFRLLVAMAVPENEHFLASDLFMKDKRHKRSVEALEDEIGSLKRQLQMAAQKEAQLIQENKGSREKMDAQSVNFWREVQRMKKMSAEVSKSKVAQFDTERKIAERRVIAISQQFREAEARASEADRAAKASHEAEVRLRLELDESTKKARALEEANQDLKRLLEQKNAAEFDMKEKLQNMLDDQGKLNRALVDKDDIISDVQGARDNMESNLDSLFADLVKLSNMYEFQEKEANDLRAQSNKLSKELQGERRQREESESALTRENEQLQSEKEKLEKKIVRYKEKIEEHRKERSEREQKLKSRAPVSYLNSLHDSLNASSAHHHSSKNGRSSATQKKGSSSRGKENSYASGSQRRERSRREEHSSSSSAFRYR